MNANTRIIVTGGGGFLGRHVVEELILRGYKNIFVPRSKDLNLTEVSAVKKLYIYHNPELIIHLAACVSGTEFNRNNPGPLFYNNIMMSSLLMEEGRRHGLKKFVGIGSACAYPESASVPFKEEDVWDGYPEETNATYGLAKKMMLVQSQAYRKQYGFNSVVLFPVNMYGPGDSFESDSSHVIPAIIKKIDEASDSDTVELWGNGDSTRDFLHVVDAAEAIVDACERYDSSDLVNLGTGKEVSIASLAETIKYTMGYKGSFVFEENKEKSRRCVDVSRARDRFGWVARIPLEMGIAELVSWWRERRSNKTIGSA